MIHKKIALFLTSIFALSLLSCSQIEDPEIQIEELKGHIEFLASDSLKGRYPGTKEDKIAAEYILKELHNKGNKNISKGKLQEFEIIHTIELGEQNQLSYSNNSYNLKSDFLPSAISSNEEVDANVVFVGYGFDIKEDVINWNDYQNISVENKWVMILKGDPENDNIESPYIAYSDQMTKCLTALEYGAAGVLLVSGETYDERDRFIELSSPKGTVNIPVIQIKRDVANEFLKSKRKTISDLEKEINATKKSVCFEIETKVKASVDLFVEKNYTYNIIAEINSTKSDEYIVIGAHYDHLGLGGFGSSSRMPDTIAAHYGADDNASGVTAILEIAEKLNANSTGFQKNILFVAFGAEEMGLLGSKFFINNSPVPKEKIKAMINLDMIGRLRNNELQIGGTGTSDRHEELLNGINKNYNFELGLSKEGYGPSDHSSFYNNDIPVFFISTGAHLDYHTPYDNPEKINYEGLKKVADFTYDLAFELATTETNLIFKEAGDKRKDSRYAHGKRFKVTLGIMPDFTGVEKRGLRADVVIKGKPAHKAGMQDGDVIVAINGKKIGDVYNYMSRLSKLKAGEIITVEIIRNDENKVLLIQL